MHALRPEHFNAPQRGGMNRPSPVAGADYTLTHPALPFTFTQPTFAGWEVSSLKEVTPTRYELFYTHPNTVTFEVAPHAVLGIDQLAYAHHGFGESTNPNGVKYDYFFDASFYSTGYVAPKGHWTYVQFYDGNIVVRIQPFRYEKHGFDGEQIITSIIKTFAFTK